MIQMTAQCDECREITPIRGLTTEAVRNQMLADGWAVRDDKLLCPKHNPARREFTTERKR